MNDRFTAQIVEWRNRNERKGFGTARVAPFIVFVGLQYFFFYFFIGDLIKDCKNFFTVSDPILSYIISDTFK